MLTYRSVIITRLRSDQTAIASKTCCSSYVGLFSKMKATVANTSKAKADSKPLTNLSI